MARRVIHRFFVQDFTKLKVDQLYQSFCGKTFMACEPPTPEEVEDIKVRTANNPICKRCQKWHEQREAAKAQLAQPTPPAKEE